MEQNLLEPKIRFSNYLVYHLLKISLVNPLLRLYFQGRIFGAEKIPKQGKLIVVSNHASLLDPPLLACAAGRPVAFMAKEELFRLPGFKQLITFLGAYPINRQGADRRAIREAIARLERGWAVGIFLEGTRTADGGVYRPKLGAAMIAAKAQAPLLPICLQGTEKILDPDLWLPQPVPITIRVGDLIEPPAREDRQELEKVTAKCSQTINHLHQL